MRPLLKAIDFKAWDQFTIEDQKITSFQLMERAANEFCSLYLKLFRDKEQKICILAGPGNNGGDGFAIARILLRAGLKNIFVFDNFITQSKNEIKDRNKNRSLLLGIPEIKWIQGEKELKDVYSKNHIYTIDAIFGTGMKRALNEDWKSIFSIVNSSSYKIVSVDIPSGLQPDQENLISDEQIIILAHYTFTFQEYKKAMTYPETGIYCGRIYLLDIRLSENKIKKSSDKVYLLDHSIWRTLNKSKIFDHKGSNGKTLHFCGSVFMPGAALLCSKAAHRSGAGYVFALTPADNVELMLTSHPELLIIQYSDIKNLSISNIISAISGLSSILAGPGLGNTVFVRKCIDDLLDVDLKIPLILDADALNALKGKTERLTAWKGPLVITPHAKEFDNLFGESGSWFERETKMRHMSKSLQICIILKGAFTRIAFNDGTLYINTSGNPGLAKAGSGDVLSGILSAHLAKYEDFKNAVLSAVYLHGNVADNLSKTISETSILATDLIEHLGQTIKALELNV